MSGEGAAPSLGVHFESGVLRICSRAPGRVEENCLRIAACHWKRSHPYQIASGLGLRLMAKSSKLWGLISRCFAGCSCSSVVCSLMSRESLWMESDVLDVAIRGVEALVMGCKCTSDTWPITPTTNELRAGWIVSWGR